MAKKLKFKKCFLLPHNEFWPKPEKHNSELSINYYYVLITLVKKRRNWKHVSSERKVSCKVWNACCFKANHSRSFHWNFLRLCIWQDRFCVPVFILIEEKSLFFIFTMNIIFMLCNDGMLKRWDILIFGGSIIYDIKAVSFLACTYYLCLTVSNSEAKREWLARGNFESSWLNWVP